MSDASSNPSDSPARPASAGRVPTQLAPSSFRGIIGIAQRDITPPIGIYAKCWGASTHDTATGIHQPLTLTAITFQAIGAPDDKPLVLISADLMSFRSREAEDAIVGEILRRASLPPERLMFCLSHTHAAPSIRIEDADRNGGHLIQPYRQHLVAQALDAIRAAQSSTRPATLTWHYGTCSLATNRDFPDPGNPARLICGFNPHAKADDTLLVARITDDEARTLGTLVNYACHPTTLAWQNTLISPDYVGAMRDLVQSHTGAPCLFLQGASGELAPAEQYTGDTFLAERHGRTLGYAVLSALEAMSTPATALTFQGAVESGAPLALWQRTRAPATHTIAADVRHLELPLKPMPPLQQLHRDHQAATDPVLKERLRRAHSIRQIVGDGPTTHMPLVTWRIGDAILVGQPNEPYSSFQLHLRAHCSDRPIAVMNLVNGSAGYLPPSAMYDRDLYQVHQTPFAPGSLERLIAAAQDAVADLLRA